MIFIDKSKFQLFPSYKLLLLIYLFFAVFAFLIDSPKEILNGLINIVTTPDILITDYIEIGGIGATLMNAALTSTFSIIILIVIGVKPNGSTLMALWLMTGFSFFGKNLLNIWPIMIGVYLFSRYQKEPILNYSLVGLLATSLAPTVSQLSFSGLFPPVGGFVLGCLLGIFIGFIISPIASYTVIAHNGYNLYNVGFAGGLIATVLMSILKSIGIQFETRLIWNTGSNHILTIFLVITFTFLIVMGLIDNKNALKDLKGITKHPGRLITDFYMQFGKSSYINMGLLGLFATAFILLVGADLNGPTLGGIFTIVGFGAFGKNLRNIIPVMIGASLTSLIHINNINDPNIILSVLFATCLAPLSGKFGWKIGILAGFIHVNVVNNIGIIHGGLNLYNNGLAGGFVVMILLPLITTFINDNRRTN